MSDDMQLLSKEDIMESDDVKFEIVDVPEWGGKVRVKALSGLERDRFESSLIRGKGKAQYVSMENVRAKTVALSCVDMQGNRIFTDKDIPWLGSKSAAALDRVYDVCSRLSKFSDEDIEELVGNSNEDQSEDS